MKIDINKILKATKYLQKAEANVKGFVGEFVVDQIANRYLPEDFKILSDVVLKSDNGTTQIDQILVSPYGIFVIEVKNYKGWIFGSNGRWTQVLYNTKHKFQSPLKQNCKHVNTLQSILKFPDEKFRSLIVFSDDVIFKTTMPDNVVIGAQGYLNYLLKHQTVLLEKDIVETSVTMIESHRLSKAEHQEYMNKLKEKYYTGDVNKPPSCPKCDRLMILRTARKGMNRGRQFWGCGGYPKCKVTMNIENDKIRNIEKVLNMFFR